MLQPIAAKLVQLKSTPVHPKHQSEWIKLDETVVLFDWNGNRFLIGRANGTVEVHESENVELNYKLAILPGNLTLAGSPRA